MIARILDKIAEGDAICYLSSINLKEYIENLPIDYKDYEVQREIVSNVYLDNLVNTVLRKYHIPPIVLIAEEAQVKAEKLVIEKFKILDGLQRTFRLNAIWKTINLFTSEIVNSNSIFQLSKLQLSRKYSTQLQDIDSSTKILQVIIEFYKTNTSKDFAIEQTYSLNNQWFEVWTGLEPEQEVNKMLVLNAGHKPVKLKHQLELIFTNLLPILQRISEPKFSVIREKQKSAIQFSKNRSVGEFHFSHLISSILSLKEGKAVTTNSALIQKLQNSEFSSEEDAYYFSYSFLSEFISSIVNIDKEIASLYKGDGVKWFGREVALVGTFGAIGFFLHHNDPNESALKIINSKLIPNIPLLNLSEFESVRNQQNLAKINIGLANKNAIFNAIYDILIDKAEAEINWDKYFNSHIEND